MAFIHSPKIVTDGLIIAVDPSNPKSYVSGSTVVRSLTNNYNGSLTNGTFYSANNGGVFNFDGVNDLINFGTGNTFFPLASFTIDLWFQSKGTVTTTGTVPGLFGFTYGVRSYFPSANAIYYAVSSGSTMYDITVTVPSIRDAGLWFNASFQATPTNTYLYINGSLVGSRSTPWIGTTIWPTADWHLGHDLNNAYQYFTGSMASYKMYNRALSVAEVQQNYNALKGRFGL